MIRSMSKACRLVKELIYLLFKLLKIQNSILAPKMERDLFRSSLRTGKKPK